MVTKKTLLSGSYPNREYAPIVSPQNNDECGDRYTPDVECQYEVHGPENTHIYVEFLSIDLDRDCSQDSLQLLTKRKHRKFCGSNSGSRQAAKTIVVNDNVAHVTFKSNLDYACRGFSGFMVVFTPDKKNRGRKKRAHVDEHHLAKEATNIIGKDKLHSMRAKTKAVYRRGTCDICQMSEVQNCFCTGHFFDQKLARGKHPSNKRMELDVKSKSEPYLHYYFNGHEVVPVSQSPAGTVGSNHAGTTKPAAQRANTSSRRARSRTASPPSRRVRSRTASPPSRRARSRRPSQRTTRTTSRSRRTTAYRRTSVRRRAVQRRAKTRSATSRYRRRTRRGKRSTDDDEWPEFETVTYELVKHKVLLALRKPMKNADMANISRALVQANGNPGSQKPGDMYSIYAKHRVKREPGDAQCVCRR